MPRGSADDDDPIGQLQRENEELLERIRQLEREKEEMQTAPSEAPAIKKLVSEGRPKAAAKAEAEKLSASKSALAKLRANIGTIALQHKVEREEHEIEELLEKQHHDRDKIEALEEENKKLKHDMKLVASTSRQSTTNQSMMEQTLKQRINELEQKSAIADATIARLKDEIEEAQSRGIGSAPKNATKGAGFDRLSVVGPGGLQGLDAFDEEDDEDDDDNEVSLEKYKEKVKELLEEVSDLQEQLRSSEETQRTLQEQYELAASKETSLLADMKKLQDRLSSSETAIEQTRADLRKSQKDTEQWRDKAAKTRKSGMNLGEDPGGSAATEGSEQRIRELETKLAAAEAALSKTGTSAVTATSGSATATPSPEALQAKIKEVENQLKTQTEEKKIVEQEFKKAEKELQELRKKASVVAAPAQTSPAQGAAGDNKIGSSKAPGAGVGAEGDGDAKAPGATAAAAAAAAATGKNNNSNSSSKGENQKIEVELAVVGLSNSDASIEPSNPEDWAAKLKKAEARIAALEAEKQAAQAAHRECTYQIAELKSASGQTTVWSRIFKCVGHED